MTATPCQCHLPPGKLSTTVHWHPMWGSHNTLPLLLTAHQSVVHPATHHRHADLPPHPPTDRRIQPHCLAFPLTPSPVPTVISAWSVRYLCLPTLLSTRLSLVMHPHSPLSLFSPHPPVSFYHFCDFSPTPPVLKFTNLSLRTRG